MLQLVNQTPFAASLLLLPNQQGIDTIYVVIKATFTLRPVVAVAEQQVPVWLADEYVGSPGQSSLRYASELHIGKPGTDIALLGHARPPRGRAEQMTVSLSVAGRSHDLLVFGNRHFTARGGISPPEPFSEMPLTFERAYGGSVGQSAATFLAEEQNPVGQGFLGNRSPAELHGQPLPNLEDPRARIGRIGDRQTPTCFALVAPSWLPRRAFAGTYDERWRRQRLPYLPDDFDRRYFHAATAALCLPAPLLGGEPCSARGVSSDGPLEFTIPRCQWRIEIEVAFAVETVTARLETLLIEPDDNRLSLSYRAELACDRRQLKVERVVVSVAQLEHAAAYPAGAA
jgi:hypothetical protein